MNAVAPPILIAGGGIGGLGTALALARAGHRVRLFERAPEFREVGAGIQLGPNVIAMFDRLGVKAAMLAQAALPKALVMRCASRTGRRCAAPRWSAPMGSGAASASR